MKESVKNTILFSILIFLLFYSFAKGVSCEEYYSYEQIEKMCMHLVKLAPNHIMNKNIVYRTKIISTIKKHQQKYGVKANWITSIVFRESSFRKGLRDSKGAFGLMQVHPYMMKKFKCYNKKTIDGQINCGTKVFRYGINLCGSYERGFAAYASKDLNCNPDKGTRLYWVVKKRKKLAIELHDLVK